MPREKRTKVRSPLRTATSPEGTFDSPVEEVVEDTVEAPKTKKVVKTRQYIVKPKCKICTAKGVYKVAGDIITLDNKMAKHFIKHDRIMPYVEFDEDGD